MTGTIRLAILSDVHAYSHARLGPSDSVPSFVEVSNPSDVPGRNPFRALRELVVREGLEADVLVNCGDMGDRAQPDAINFTWRETRELAALLKADEIVATAGNHDVDSRGVFTDHDARGTLLNLNEFPFKDQALNFEYWARNVVVFESASTRWVVLNSAAYHGFQDEHDHGRISRTTLEYLRKRLDSTSNSKLNILVCHHHVYKIGNIDLDDYSAMKDGSALLSVLEHGGYGSWIVFHGHRHWPSITYAPGGNNSPVVFAAGSFSAVLWAEIAARVRNQFYVVDLELQAGPGRVKGTFTAWDFVSDEGFRPAQEGSGLPHRGGFGGSLSGREIAEKIAEIVRTSGAQWVPWESIIEKVSDIAFTLPDDMRQCIATLSDVHQLSVLDSKGKPHQVGA